VEGTSIRSLEASIRWRHTWITLRWSQIREESGHCEMCTGGER
jgi:hypothetical protein